MYNFKKLALIVLVFVFTIATVQVVKAESYQGDLRLGYATSTSTDEPSGNETTEKNYYGAGTFYFSPVNLDNGPWEEAAFLQQASNISIIGYKTDLDNDGDTADGFGLGAEIEYVVSPELPVYLLLGYDRLTIEFDEMDVEFTVNTIETNLGYYLLKNALIFISYENEKTEYDILGNTSEETIHSYALNFKLVNTIDANMAYHISATVGRFTLTDDNDNTDDKTNNVFILDFDFYPMPQVGIGAGIRNISGDLEGAEGNTYYARIKGYVIPQFGIGFTYNQFVPKDDEIGDASKEFEIEVTGRF